MAVKTWANGETFSYIDVNNYGTNNGLQMIGAYGVSSSPTNTVVSNIFTSTYENYRIVGTNFFGATGSLLGFRMCAGGTPSTGNNYFNGGIQITSTNSRATFGQVSAGYWILGLCGVNSTIGSTFVLDVYAPQKVRTTGLSCTQTSVTAGVVYNYVIGGNHNVISAFDGIQFLHNAGADAYTGTIRVYGYRET